MDFDFKRFIAIFLAISLLSACHGKPRPEGRWERVWTKFDHYTDDDSQEKEPGLPLEPGRPCVSSEVGEPGCD